MFVRLESKKNLAFCRVFRARNYFISSFMRLNQGGEWGGADYS